MKSYQSLLHRAQAKKDCMLKRDEVLAKLEKYSHALKGDLEQLINEVKK